jgi:hypothetical protein
MPTGCLALLRIARPFSIDEMRFTSGLAITCMLGVACAEASTAAPDSTSPVPAKAPVDQLIPWLLDEDQQLRGVPFSEVIFDSTGRKVIPFDPKNAVDQRIAKAIGAACNETINRLNAPDSAIQNLDRINEVSSHFEDLLRELLNATSGLHCDFPLTTQGKLQRSGYPDLRIVDFVMKRVFYLDPKLYAAGSRDSSFRALFRAEEGDQQSARRRGAFRRRIRTCAARKWLRF